jgi:hypothetical protein
MTEKQRITATVHAASPVSVVEAKAILRFVTRAEALS